MLILFLACSVADPNPCHSLLHATGKRYNSNISCERSTKYDPVDASYTCLVWDGTDRHTCDISVSDIECPYKSIKAGALNKLYQNFIITTLKEKNDGK